MDPEKESENTRLHTESFQIRTPYLNEKDVGLSRDLRETGESEVEKYEHSLINSINLDHNYAAVHPPVEKNSSCRPEFQDEMAAFIPDNFSATAQTVNSFSQQIGSVNDVVYVGETQSSTSQESMKLQYGKKNADTFNSGGAISLLKKNCNECLCDYCKAISGRKVFSGTDNKISESDSLSERDSSNKLTQDSVVQKHNPISDMASGQCNLRETDCTATSGESEEGMDQDQSNCCGVADKLSKETPGGFCKPKSIWKREYFGFSSKEQSLNTISVDGNCRNRNILFDHDREISKDAQGNFVAPFRSLNWEVKDTSESSVFYAVAKSFVFRRSKFGYVRLEAMKSVSPVPSRHHDIIFSVFRGKVVAKIKETYFLLEELDTFFVPRGNPYSLVNIQDNEAVLSFMSTKKHILKK